MRGEFDRLRRRDRWIARVRAAAVPLAVLHVSFTSALEGSYLLGAWVVVGVLAVGAVAFLALAERPLDLTARRRVGLAATVFDAAVLFGYTLAFAAQSVVPARQLLFLVVLEGAFRYRLAGAIAGLLATVPALVGYEFLRMGVTDDFRVAAILFQLAVELILAIAAGLLVAGNEAERARAVARATEAEALRDELGRRGDMLDAAGRCARALSSSLDLDEAFGAFIRELRGLVPFDRVAIVTAEDGDASTLASAGRGEEAVYPTGARNPLAGSLLEEIVATGRTIERADMDPPRYPEEEPFLELGLRSRVAAPFYAGVRPVGMLSLVRFEPSSFAREEVELLTLLGRLVGSAVQNIRAYESERTTVEELRRLSALRADFVSLVSHELRSPMAAVIGSAQTLQERWRELTSEQRQAFLALIADETNRLAALVGDVLDTSRIESGSFTYSFRDVDVGGLLRDAVATASVAQEEVPIDLRVDEPLPAVRGDGERLRQVVANLLDNAVKYSPDGMPVEVRAYASNGSISVSVRDRGPGIASEHQRVIFEKFGRVGGGAAKPGTGLGLFIARSIAEAHGGRLEVNSVAGAGATFTLQLPA